MKQLFTLFLALLFVVPATPSPTAQHQESVGTGGLIWPKVGRGAHGLRVTALQYLLRSRGYKVATDGRFGYATETALRKFQAKNKLQVDGRIGWQSWEALTPDLKSDARGDAVRALQTLLIQAGYKLTRDGIYGNSTEKALVTFQKRIGSTGSKGKVDDTIWCYLSGGKEMEGA